MATEAQIKDFIKTIAPHAQTAYKELGKILPSVCIGMACVESAFGTSQIMRKHNAYFGQKVGTGKTATKYWDGKFFTSQTKEEYEVGKHTIINAAFRAYGCMLQSVLNFYELLNTKLYSKVKADANYELQMAQIKECGYMTSSTEVKSVITIIKKYNLTQYDLVEKKPTEPEEPEWKFIIGKNYSTQTDLYIRKQPNGEKLTLKDLTINGRLHSYEDQEGKAILKKDTKVTCKAICVVRSSIWIQIPSGWVCARSANGKVYIK